MLHLSSPLSSAGDPAGLRDWRQKALALLCFCVLFKLGLLFDWHSLAPATRPAHCAQRARDCNEACASHGDDNDQRSVCDQRQPLAHQVQRRSRLQPCALFTPGCLLSPIVFKCPPRCAEDMQAKGAQLVTHGLPDQLREPRKETS